MRLRSTALSVRADVADEGGDGPAARRGVDAQTVVLEQPLDVLDELLLAPAVNRRVETGSGIVGQRQLLLARTDASFSVAGFPARGCYRMYTGRSLKSRPRSWHTCVFRGNSTARFLIAAGKSPLRVAAKPIHFPDLFSTRNNVQAHRRGPDPSDDAENDQGFRHRPIAWKQTLHRPPHRHLLGAVTAIRN